MSEQDDVMELLDSIDKPKTQSKRAQRNKPRKRHNEDIMDFLDEIASEGNTPVPPEPEAKDARDTNAAAEPADPAPKTAADTVDTPKEPIPDPLGAMSSWWNKAKPGLWEQATKAASKASEAVKQGEQQLGRLDLGSLQKSLTTFVSDIVPPISAHEQLGVHVFHDLAGYPAVDGIVRSVFECVMDQVEGGGELNMIVQKGVDRHAASSGSRKLNYFQGTVDNAKKLCLASVEDFRRDHIEKRSEPTENARLSEIYISIQAVLEDGAAPEEQFQFVCCMCDFTNNVSLSASSQKMPAQWAYWLDDEDSAFSAAIADPRPWVLEWVEESISLTLGTLAQRYVILRMGIEAATPTEAATAAAAKESK